MTEDEMVIWITNSMDMSLGKLWVLGEGQGGLACCSSWSHRVRHD